jgi:hypothetical protein
LVDQQNPPPADPPDLAAGDRGANKPAKPDGFPETLTPYWNDDKGADYAKLGEDVAALTAFKAEQDARAALVPDKPEDYELALPASLKSADRFTPDETDPILPLARDFAKRKGFTQDDFKEMVGLSVQPKLAEDALMAERSKAENQLLGTKAIERRTAISTWTAAPPPEEPAAAKLHAAAKSFVKNGVYLAEQVIALETLMELAKGGGPKLSAGGREASQPQQISEEEWAKMSPTQKIEYGHSHPVQTKVS